MYNSTTNGPMDTSIRAVMQSRGRPQQLRARSRLLRGRPVSPRTASAADTRVMAAMRGAGLEGVIFDYVKKVAMAHKVLFGIGAAALIGGVVYMFFGKKKH